MDEPTALFAYLALGAIVIEPLHLRGRTYVGALVFWFPLVPVAYLIGALERVTR